METDWVYFDTTYLVRLYLPDSGADLVQQKASEFSKIACGWHGQIEFIAALHRAFREDRICQSQLEDMLDQFERDCDEGLFHWIELKNSAKDKLSRVFRKAPATSFLRAADALHLACAADYGFAEVYSNDRHFLLAAELFGLRGINVIT